MSIGNAIVDKLIVGTAAAAMLGAGGTVLTNWYKNGQQDIKIEQALRIQESLDTIESKLDSANALNARLITDVDHLRREQDRIRDKLDVKEER